MRGRWVRCELVFVAVSALVGGLVAGTLQRRDARYWPEVRPGQPLPAALQPLIQQVSSEDEAFAIVPSAADSARFVAANDRHRFTASFDRDGVHIETGAAPLTMQLRSVGRFASRRPHDMTVWQAEKNRISRRGVGEGAAGVTEWYVNGPLGLEQGFTIDAPPKGSGPVVVKLAVGAAWDVSSSPDGSRLRLRHRDAGNELGYSGLHAYDARQQPLAATMTADDGQIVIRVDDADAAYPVTIDPFIQQQTLTAFDGAPGDRFGGNIALAGNTVVVGADSRDAARGAAYVFVRSGATWSLQAKLTPDDPAVGKRFGVRLAISGETLVIGAPGDSLNGPLPQGSAYVFVRSGTQWSQQAKLIDPTGQPSDAFGTVAIDGNTIVVGAIGSDDAGNAPLNSGAAFVFVRSGTSWSLQQKLRADDEIGFARFGQAVAISGETILVGAPGSLTSRGLTGAVYAFDRIGTQWLQRQKIVDVNGLAEDNFGIGVAIDGNRALVAASKSSSPRTGKVLFLRRPALSWEFLAAVFQDGNGVSAVAFDDPLAVIGNFFGVPSDARVFVVRVLTDGFQVESVLENPSTSGAFGGAVAVSASNETIVVGATEGTSASGRAVVFANVTAGPPVPPVVATPAVTGSTVGLSWSAATGATRYQVRAGTSPGGSNAFNGDVGNVTAIKAVNVATGSYFVRVFAVNASGESLASNEVRVDVGVPGPCPPPAAPANLSRIVNGSLVSLTWGAATGATSYLVEAGSASGLANLAVIDTGSPILGLQANAPPGTYFVRVRAKNGCGLSAPSNQVTVTVG